MSLVADINTHVWDLTVLKNRLLQNMDFSSTLKGGGATETVLVKSL